MRWLLGIVRELDGQRTDVSKMKLDEAELCLVRHSFLQNALGIYTLWILYVCRIMA